MFVRPCPSGRNASLGRDVLVDGHRVHAVRRQELGDRPQVCGGDADRAAALVAMDDDARERVGPAEHAAHLVEVPGDHGLPSARARVAPALVARHGVHPNAEAELGPQFAQPRQVAGALRAEAKVLADDHEARVQDPRDELAREALGLPGGERGVEATDIDALDAQIAHELGAPLERRQEGRRARPDDGAGVGVEREHGRRETDRARVRDGLAEHRLVTEMHSVEVPDHQHGRNGFERVGAGRVVDADDASHGHLAGTSSTSARAGSAAERGLRGSRLARGRPLGRRSSPCNGPGSWPP